MASGWCSRALALALLCAGAALAAPAAAAVYATQDEALRAAFPDADRFEPRRFVLDQQQAARIESLATAPLERRVWTLSGAFRGNELLGWALIDVRTVRTFPEALLVVLSPDGSVRSLRMLAFHEPPEYKPSERWLSQMDGKRLGPELHLKREIHAIAGATLSSQAVTRSVRTALALYQVLLGNENGAAE